MLWHKRSMEYMEAQWATKRVDTSAPAVAAAIQTIMHVFSTVLAPLGLRVGPIPELSVTHLSPRDMASDAGEHFEWPGIPFKNIFVCFICEAIRMSRILEWNVFLWQPVWFAVCWLSSGLQLPEHRRLIFWLISTFDNTFRVKCVEQWPEE